MSKHRDNTNYYQVLEISPDVPQNEIHKAYQRAKSTYSQDNPALYSMFTKEEARELSRLIEEAYTILGNQVTRKSYDDQLRGGQSTSKNSGQKSSSKPAAVDASMASMPGDHDALPDFAIPEAGQTLAEPRPGTSRHSTMSARTGQAAAPAGSGKTPLSTYKLDNRMETEIAEMTEFDGPALQKIRQYKGIELEKVIEYTRISRTYLAALESNNYSALPAPVFVRGFIIQVARLLGLDENKVSASYMNILKGNVGKK